MKNRNVDKILLGVTLVVLAAYVIVSKLTFLPEISIISVIFSVVFIAWAINGLFKREYVSVALPLALIGCQYDDLLGITAITPWTLIICAIAIGIGLDIIFRDSRRNWKWNVTGGDGGNNTFNVDEESVYAENNLGENVHYAYCSDFRRAQLENNLGGLTVHLTDCVVSPSGADIYIENNLGCTTVFIPSNWNVRMQKETNLGNIEIKGVNVPDTTLPEVYLKAECNMGNIIVEFTTKQNEINEMM